MAPRFHALFEQPEFVVGNYILSNTVSPLAWMLVPVASNYIQDVCTFSASCASAGPSYQEQKGAFAQRSSHIRVLSKQLQVQARTPLHVSRDVPPFSIGFVSKRDRWGRLAFLLLGPLQKKPCLTLYKQNSTNLGALRCTGWEFPTSGDRRMPGSKP